MRLIIGGLDRACIRAAAYFDRQELNMEPGSAGDYFLNRLCLRDQSSILGAKFSLKKSIVGIGAPAASWISQSGKHLQANIIIPEHAEVANAVGAAVGCATEKIEILIRNDSISNAFVVYSPIDRTTHESLELATEYAIFAGEKCILKLADNRHYHLTTRTDDIVIEDILGSRKLFIERTVILHACFEQ